MSSGWTARQKEYARLLRDPRWQRKRLDMLARDQWTCQDCETPHRVLQVHHEWYDEGLLPWEYPDTCYVTLCLPCHTRRSKAVQAQVWAQRVQSDEPPGPDEWAQVFQEPLERLAMDRRMKATHWRVFFYMIGSMPYSGRITIRQATVAQDLGIQVNAVSKVLSDLAGLGVLEKLPTSQLPATYVLGHAYVRKGRDG